MPTSKGSSGLKNFIKKHGLWNEDQSKSAASVLRKIQELELESIRLSFADQHGLLRQVYSDFRIEAFIFKAYR